MIVRRHEGVKIVSDIDLLRVRQEVRAWSTELGFRLTEQTKLITAAAELSRNTLIHGGGGSFGMESLREGSRNGLRLTFEDNGPGIPDIELALRDGYTTGGGLGLGLGGARRLTNEFQIESEVGAGTRVTITRWR